MNNSTLIEGTNGTNETECAGNCQRPTIFTPEIFMMYNMFLTISLIIGISGNGLVLAVFAKHKASTPTDWFIIFITIFDFISSVFNVPIYLTFTTGQWRTIGSDAFCKVHMFVSQSVVLSSTFLICGLAIERYLKVCRQSGLKISKPKAFYICLTITIITTLLSTPCIKMYTNTRGQCTTSVLIEWVFYYYLMVLLTYILAFVVVTFSYTNISLVVLKSERNLSRHNGAVQSDGITWYSWYCCCCFNILGTKRRIAPMSFVTHTSSDGTSRHDVATNETDINVVSGATKEEMNDNGKNQIQSTSTSKFLTIPPTQVSRHTKSTTLSVSWESSNCGSHDNSQPSTLRPDKMVASSQESAVAVQGGRRHQGKRTTRITFAVCVIFIVSWIPPWMAFLLLTIPSMRTNPEALKFGLFGKMTYLLNTFMNPILYFGLNRKFREQTAEFICFWK